MSSRNGPKDIALGPTGTKIPGRDGTGLAVVSLFCGPGGFDVGFAQAGFTPVLAVDADAAACKTFKQNHASVTVIKRDLSGVPRGYVSDRLKEIPDSPIPVGVIGGPPCQAFSKSNGHKKEGDPRAELPRHYAAILKDLNTEFQLDFFVFENVLGLRYKRHQEAFKQFKRLFESAGFNIFEAELDALNFAIPQVRKRVFIVGLNKHKYPDKTFIFPTGDSSRRITVRDTIGQLPPPLHFQRGMTPGDIPHHPNHWCMKPRSPRFTNGTLKAGEVKWRPFRMLHWDEPSWTVAYGHREVHIHPSGQRRLSVYEAMLLQGFPPDYELCGTLSDQIRLVSDAVPPPLARALAAAIAKALGYDQSGSPTRRA